MKPAPFDYQRVESVGEAIGLLGEHGPEAKVIAGGQSLTPMMNMRLVEPSVLIDIARVRELQGVAGGDSLDVGAAVTQTALLNSREVSRGWALIGDALSYSSHRAIRNRGTIGGSIAHADPAAELPAVLLALDARVTVRGPHGEREIAASEFFVTYLTTSLEPDELVTTVHFPKSGGTLRTAFVEVARRHGDFALVAVAFAYRLEDGLIRSPRLVLAGVADKPVRAFEAEALLDGGREGDAALASELAGAVSASLDPTGDVHATSRYRRHLAGVLAQRSLKRCALGAE